MREGKPVLNQFFKPICQKMIYSTDKLVPTETQIRVIFS